MNRAEAARKVALAVAGGRVVIGVTMATAPRLVATPWVGREGRKSGAQLLTRAAGGRDLALGAGAIGALARRSDVRPWIAAQTAADLTDLVATAMADDLPPMGRRGVLALAGGAAALGVATLIAIGNPQGDSGASR